MAFQKFKMKKQTDWSKRKHDKDQDVWRKKQRSRKSEGRSW